VKVVTVIGARPQFVKAALVSEALARHRGVQEVVVHTGQHYDAKMSDVFFEELGMRPPAWHLAIGSDTHGRQSGAMMARLDDVLERERPDVVLVYGDTNSTLAGALAAVKLHIPVAHVEAGLRSYNRRMPEEINRIVADVVSSRLFCPTRTAVENLEREGIRDGVTLAGDVMLDMLLRALPKARARDSLERHGVRPRVYYLATVHRAENTDDPRRLESLLSALQSLDAPVLFPLHPRTRRVLSANGAGPAAQRNLSFIEPVGYLDMVALEDGARAILTDSGGVQKEALFVQRPCITLREETEWPETTRGGWNQVVGVDTAAILAAVANVPGEPADVGAFGDGNAAERMASEIAGM
jgi:UDP-N-acetylglucosamine 2-epimerase